MMQVPRSLPFLLLCFVTGSVPRALAQFPSFPAADKVLGAVDLVSRGTEENSPYGIVFPSGIGIDPGTGKLFAVSNSQNRILRYSNPAGLSNGAQAESVFGQVNFSGIASGSTATRLNTPYGIHLDSRGRLWVADSNNNRVLMFQGASNVPGFGANPDLVLGQPNFTTVTVGNSATKMFAPEGVFVDSDDNLWVADTQNCRILKFVDVTNILNGAAASVVLGQTTFGVNTIGTSATQMFAPVGVTVDGAGRLWVCDQSNHRVLRFDAAATLTDGAPADAVLGQSDFTTNATAISASGFNRPTAPLVDAAGTLYITDFANNRVLFFKNAASKPDGAPADGVIGQSDFTTNTAGFTERQLDGPYLGLALDAAGALWISDSNNNRVLRFSPDRSATPPRTTGKVPKSTSKSSLALRGTATDTSGVGSVKFRVGNKGAYRPAAGTTSWRLTAKLKPGKNTISIIVVDIFGNTSAPKRVTVKRL